MLGCKEASDAIVLEGGESFRPQGQGASPRRCKREEAKTRKIQPTGGFGQKEELCKAPRAEVSLVVKAKKEPGQSGQGQIMQGLDPEPGSGPYSKCAGWPWGVGRELQSGGGLGCAGESRRGSAQSRCWHFGRQRGEGVRKRGLRCRLRRQD